MSFDAIPEDRVEGFPCPQCENGSVTKNEQGVWECDNCDFIYAGGDE